MMLMTMPTLLKAIFTLSFVLAFEAVARGQSIEPFFARKTVTIYVGYTSGGSYDVYARMVARHLGKHLPGRPTIVVQNMPGAGSLKAANYIFRVAPKDGTALGVIVESAALEQVLANSAVQYDATKFVYVGRVAKSNNIFMQWHTSKVQSIEDSRQRESSFAGTGPGSLAETVPMLLNALLGTKFKLISGYPASTQAMLAMEREEVEGAGSSWATVRQSKQDWLREKKIRIFLQSTPERDPELADTPCLGELGETPDDKQVFALYAAGSAVGRAVLAPPGLSDERLQTLREGFNAMINDQDFVAEIRKANLEFEPISGAQVQDIIARTLSVPDSVRERARAALGR
jgi:tripartite-type tricarboxylate transporter receptor subunit TctC